MSEGNVAVLDPKVSLIRGGPFYQAQLKTRLILPDQWNLGKRILFAIAVGWLPLVFITALFDRGGLTSLLTDYKVAARMLIAVPVLLLGQVMMESKFRMIVKQVREDLIAPADLPRFTGTLAFMARWRDSVLPELAIIALVVLHTTLSLSGKIGLASAWALQGTADAAALHLSPAGWYYTTVSVLVYQFLVGLSLWKWLLWTIFLFKLSRMKLQLVASHPDKHAGIGFLGMSTMAFAPTAFAVAAAVGATWRYEILSAGIHLSSFKAPAIALLVLTVVIALGPLALFVPKLAAVRRNGILQYGSLAHLHSTDFHGKWILHRKEHEAELLAAPEISSLTDLAASVQNVEDMQAFPAGKGSVIPLILAIAIPLIPAISAQVPLKVVLKSLMEAMK